MARRIGLNVMPLEQVREVVLRERADQWDLYAPLSHARIEVGGSLDPVEQRYTLTVPDRDRDRNLRLTPTAVSQLCAIAGITPFEIPGSS